MVTGYEYLTLAELERRLNAEPTNANAALELARRWISGVVTVTAHQSPVGEAR